MTTTACMGGFCSRRQGCPHYHAEDRTEPAERRCVRGEDGNLFDGRPIIIHRPAGSWERRTVEPLLAHPGPFEGLLARRVKQ